jgi:iron only hydrogenase large subunit-like protein
MQNKIDMIKNNKAIALLAPTFAIDFKYPNIIGMLKQLGFDKVTELTYGARMVNWAYVNYIKENIGQKLFIASPCPTVVAFVQAQYPDLVKYLVPVVSPLVAMAKISKKHHPEHKVVFISPCYAKQNIEAPKYPEYIDEVITLKELMEMFDSLNIKEEKFNKKYSFDFFIREYTKIYPISGGLGKTAHIAQFFKKDEILVTDGIENVKQAFDDVMAGTSKYRFMDILNCPGGCIGGPAIYHQNISIDQRREIVKDYTTDSSKENMGKTHGKIDYSEGIDFSVQF